ncbi:Ig-like domain-containing protein, partial [Vibrio parahaemolyticus]
MGGAFSGATLAYSSSNTSVASVSSDGTLTANATGSTSVTVKASAGGLTV